MIFYTTEATYYAKTIDNKFYKLGSHDYGVTEWLSGAWEIESTSEFSSHKGLYFKDNIDSRTEGEYIPKFTVGDLSSFLRNDDSNEIRTILDWAGLRPEQIDTFYLHLDGEDAGFPLDPTWWQITAQEAFELTPEENGDLTASLPDELLKLIQSEC
jgi:hypothetical protein